MTAATKAADLQSRWTLEVQLAQKQFEKYTKRAEKVVKRYRDERDSARGASRFNILWSNVQTIRPAVYAKKPKAEVERRHRDHDPVGRVASMILERALQFDVEYREEFHRALGCVLDDRLLPGRGVLWARYEKSSLTDDAADPADQERCHTDYVYWQDFLHSVSRTWEEVRWIARRVYLTREQGVARFGEIFESVPLSHKPEDLKEDEGPVSEAGEKLAKAVVWEIWCKEDRTVYWMAEGFDRILDAKSDPLGLPEFWPCPRPMFATITTDSLVPVPDFCQYQDQAEELDTLTARIDLMVDACRVSGVYDGSAKGIKDLLSARRADNVLIPVDSWAMFADKGGVKGAIQFLPLDDIVKALSQLYAARESVKQTIYEITGLADVIRGASDSSETATAQRIKSRFASLRIQELQYDMARFASEILCIKAHIMVRFFQPETLLSMAAADQFQAVDQQLIPQAMQLLKSGPVSAYRIRVASDSMIEMDQEGEKKARMEFLAGVGMYFERALPVVQAAPQVAPLIFELLKFGVRAFPVGRELEGAFDQGLAALPQQEPADIQQKRAELGEREQAVAQQEQAIQKAGMDVEKKALKNQYDEAVMNLRTKAESDQRALQDQYDAEVGSATESLRAVEDETRRDAAKNIAQNTGELKAFGQAIGEALTALSQALAESTANNAEALGKVAEAVAAQSAQMQKFMTAKRRGYRDASGALVSEVMAEEKLQ